MSVLPAEVHAALAQLLVGLQSPDNVIRTQAEAQLQDEWQSARPEILLMALAEQIIGSEDLGVRLISPFDQYPCALTSLSPNIFLSLFPRPVRLRPYFSDA
jgi:hypothetical protein